MNDHRPYSMGTEFGLRSTLVHPCICHQILIFSQESKEWQFPCNISGCRSYYRKIEFRRYYMGVKKVGIVNRIKLNARANLNHILTKAEDPQKMLDQFLLDMRSSVREVKGAVATAIVGVKKLEREIASYSEKADEWEKRALLALKKDNEELARKALEQKNIYRGKENICKTELEKQKLTVQELKESLADMETRLEELYQKRIDLIKQNAQLQRRIAQTASTQPTVTQIDIDTSAIDAYDRMVDRVRDMEAQAEALAELAEMDDVEAEFRKLEKETTIDEELKSMKTQI